MEIEIGKSLIHHSAPEDQQNFATPQRPNDLTTHVQIGSGSHRQTD